MLCHLFCVCYHNMSSFLIAHYGRDEKEFMLEWMYKKIMMLHVYGKKMFFFFLVNEKAIFWGVRVEFGKNFVKKKQTIADEAKKIFLL